MAEWHGHGLTGLSVGFNRQGLLVEHSKCDHLNRNQQAHGYSSFKVGEDVHMNLMCKHCFDAYTVKRAKDLVCCNYCATEFLREEIRMWTPYDREGLSVEETELAVCTLCWESDEHQALLKTNQDIQLELTEGDENLWDPGIGPECNETVVVAEDFRECSDCGGEFHVAQLQQYVPFDRGEGNIEDLKLLLCVDCRTQPQHLGRLRNDALDRNGGFKI